LRNCGITTHWPGILERKAIETNIKIRRHQSKLEDISVLMLMLLLMLVAIDNLYSIDLC
jgi:hypothetical protein